MEGMRYETCPYLSFEDGCKVRITCPEQSIHTRAMRQGRGIQVIETLKMGVGVRTKEKAKVSYSLFSSSDGIGAYIFPNERCKYG